MSSIVLKVTDIYQDKFSFFKRNKIIWQLLVWVRIDKFHLQSKDIAIAVYSNDWTKSMLKDCRSLIFIMIKSQKGIMFFYYRMFTLSLNTFIWVNKCEGNINIHVLRDFEISVNCEIYIYSFKITVIRNNYLSILQKFNYADRFNYIDRCFLSLMMRPMKNEKFYFFRSAGILIQLTIFCNRRLIVASCI